MTIIKVENAKKHFGQGETLVKAVDNVSLSIKSGEFVSITGKSGSGKSTLLYLIGLLDSPTSGKVIFNSKNIDNLSRNARRQIRLSQIGYVFQDYSLMPSLSALDNVKLPLLMKGFINTQAQQDAIKALSDVGLEHRKNNDPSKLSGGEKQRVGIARALAKQPKVIIADEPTANLDSKTSKQIIDLFLNLNKSGQTIVMVTHEKEYANIAKTKYVMKDGKLK